MCSSISSLVVFYSLRATQLEVERNNHFGVQTHNKQNKRSRKDWNRRNQRNVCVIQLWFFTTDFEIYVFNSPQFVDNERLQNRERFYPKFWEREQNYGFETFASLPIKLNMTDSTLTSAFPSEFLSVRLKVK
jgi:hypothetical protein